MIGEEPRTLDENDLNTNKSDEIVLVLESHDLETQGTFAFTGQSNSKFIFRVTCTCLISTIFLTITAYASCISKLHEFTFPKHICKSALVGLS